MAFFINFGLLKLCNLSGNTIWPQTSVHYSKCRTCIFVFLAFYINFCLTKIDMSGNTVCPKASVNMAWKLHKMSHMNFWYLGIFISIFVLLNLTCLVTLFARKLQVVKNSSKLFHLKFLILAFSYNFCLIKSDLSRNTAWLEYVHTKCKRSSLRLQSWMRLFCNFHTQQSYMYL